MTAPGRHADRDSGVEAGAGSAGGAPAAAGRWGGGAFDGWDETGSALDASEKRQLSSRQGLRHVVRLCFPAYLVFALTVFEREAQAAYR